MLDGDNNLMALVWEGACLVRWNRQRHCAERLVCRPPYLGGAEWYWVTEISANYEIIKHGERTPECILDWLVEHVVLCQVGRDAAYIDGQGHRF